MKINKIILINLLLILSLLAIIELFFQINKHYRFIEIQNTYSIDNNKKLLNAKEAEIKYGFNILDIPADYKADFDPRLKSFKASDLDDSTRANRIQQNTPNSKEKYFNVKLKLLPPNDNIEVYSADYKTDENDLRRVENQDHKKATKFVLALGDSFTYGEGVSQGQDYPSQLAKKIGNNWKVYNFGRLGGGPNDTLFMLEHQSYKLDVIKEKSGIVIWYFIDAQLERMLCTLKCYQTDYDSFINYKPNYEWDGSDLKYKDEFRNSKDPKRLLLRILGKSEIINLSGLGRSGYSKEQLKIFTHSFKKISTELKKRFLVEHFYIVLLNTITPYEKFVETILSEKDLTLLDFTDIPFYLLPNSKIPIDGHPSGEFYWILTEVLKTKIDFK